jgi:hypothetical protein
MQIYAIIIFYNAFDEGILRVVGGVEVWVEVCAEREGKGGVGGGCKE